MKKNSGNQIIRSNRNGTFILTSAALTALGIVPNVIESNVFGYLNINVVATGVSGTGITMINGNSITLTTASIGAVINFGVYATAVGTDSSFTNDGLKSATFRLRSPLGNGVIKGDMSLGTLISPFNGTGSQTGLRQDVDGDLDKDYGATSIGSSTNMVLPSSNSTVLQDTSGSPLLLYTFDLTITSLPTVYSGTTYTTVIAQPRNNTAAFNWTEDSVAKTTANGTATFTNTTVSLAESYFSLSTGLTAGLTNVADNTDISENPGSSTPGYVKVTGGGIDYISEIDGLTADANRGSVKVYNPDQATTAIESPVYAMIWLRDTDLSGGATIQDLINSLIAYNSTHPGAFDVITSGGEYDILSSKYYDSSAQTFNLLIRFNQGMPQNGYLNWDFQTASDIVVDEIAIVPEPNLSTIIYLPINLALFMRPRKKGNTKKVRKILTRFGVIRPVQKTVQKSAQKFKRPVKKNPHKGISPGTLFNLCMQMRRATAMHKDRINRLPMGVRPKFAD